MKYLAIALASAALTGAQTPAISIRPNTAGLGGPTTPIAGSHTGVPVLGYLVGPGALDLRVIVGTAKGAQIGESLALPSGSRHLFIPPREHFVLLESSAAEPLATWLPAKGLTETTPIFGAISHPDAVAFSARGEAAVAYARNSGQLQILSGLPGESKVVNIPALTKFGEPALFAVSDDGAVVVVALANGTVVVSQRAGAWQPLPSAYGANALLFVPNTHHLVVSDLAQQTVGLVTNVGDTQPNLRLLAQSVSADRLAFTKEGGTLLAASSSQSKIWTLDLKAVTPLQSSSAVIDSLLPMRDGHTFLLSSRSLSLLNIAIEGDGASGFVPVKH